MLNRSGVRSNSYTGPVQILANVTHQYSVGAIVAQAVGALKDGKRLAKAGTPVVIDTLDAQEPVVEAGDETEANGVLLHDVDVTNGNANGTVLLFGVVNVNRVDDTTATKLEALGGNVGQVILVKR